MRKEESKGRGKCEWRRGIEEGWWRGGIGVRERGEKKRKL